MDLIYPPKCMFCGEVLHSGKVCMECEKTLPYTKGDSVHQRFPYVNACYSPLYYEDGVREAVLKFKFGHREFYSVKFGEIMSECAEKNLDCGGIDVISYVPLSRKRQKQRGYNQAKLLAKEISKRTDIPLASTLKKIKNIPAQSGIKDAKIRRANVIGVYSVPNAEKVRDKTVLLIDDVVTTGATLSECARTLKRAGADKVYCLSIARAKD